MKAFIVHVIRIISLSVCLCAPASLMGATVSGKVRLEGSVPANEAIKMDADPVCQMQHSAEVFQERIIANPDGTLRNVLVYVKEGLGQSGSAPPAEPVVLDQLGCQYKPHVFGIQAGQTLKIVNSDDTLHNVHCKTRQSSVFNLAMPFKGLELEQKFDQPDLVKFVCEVHPWMSAYAGIFSHPYFSVTQKEGSFEIKNLPAGTYVIEAWHEKLGTRTQSITVAEGDASSVEFTFKAGE